VSRALESAAAVDTGATPSTAKAGYVYERRRPELGTLHQVVRDNLQTLYAAVEEGSASPLPEFVRREPRLWHPLVIHPTSRVLRCGASWASSQANPHRTIYSGPSRVTLESLNPLLSRSLQTWPATRRCVERVQAPGDSAVVLPSHSRPATGAPPAGRSGRLSKRQQLPAEPGRTHLQPLAGPRPPRLFYLRAPRLFYLRAELERHVGTFTIPDGRALPSAP
jgi:hypothetical protein